MSNQKPKKILTIEDLVQFCQTQNFNKFSSRDTGYQLSVQVPASFEVAKENNDDTLLFCKVKCFHIGINRNQSSVTKAAAEKAMKTMAYKPILADFCTIIDDDGNEVRDFTSHTMEIDDDGNVNYIERQIGAFTADKPYIEHDDEVNKDFVFAIAAIPREYTDAASIIERKNGTKVSVELLINEMEYSAKDRVLELTDITVQGLTCLGTDPNTGKQVEEGMKNSRLDIIDFSQDNNSVVNHINDNEANNKLIDALNRLNNNLEKFNIKSFNAERKEEIGSMNEEIKVEEEVTEVEAVEETEETVVETTEEVVEEVSEEVTETEEFTEEEVAKTETDETVEEDAPEVGEDLGITETEACGKKKKRCEEETEDVENTEETEKVDVTETETCGKKKKRCSISIDETKREFELSLDDIQYALYNLVNDIYAEADNTYYGVTVYDSYVVMHDWWNGRNYRQSYSRDNDNFSLVGDRVEVYANWLTKEEEAALDEMKANYSSISEELSKYQKAEIDAQKSEIISDEAYAEFVETDEFKEIAKNIDTYSVDELKTACELAFAKCVKRNGKFSLNVNENKPEKKVNKMNLNVNFEQDDNEPYGDYFKSIKTY